MHISTPQPTANLEHSCAYHDYDKLDWYDYRWRPKGLKPGVFSYVPLLLRPQSVAITKG